MAQLHRTPLSALARLALTMLLASASTSAVAVSVFDFETTLPVPRTGARAPRPVSVTVGGGEVCVTDATTTAGHVFNQRNAHVFSTGLLARLSSPQDLTVEVDGDFVCTDNDAIGRRTIRKLNLFGEPLTYAPEPPIDGWRPHHVIVARNGDYITLDQEHGLLARHDPATGTLVWARGLREEGGSEILGVGRPAEAPDGRIYVPLGGAKQILVLEPDGKTATSFGTRGTARGRLSFPVGIAFCPNGSIAVLDRMRHTVLIYTPEHRFESEFGTFGAGPGAFYHPIAIASDGEGRVYVAQGFEGLVHVFRFRDTTSLIESQDTNWRADIGDGARSPTEGRKLSEGLSARLSTHVRDEVDLLMNRSDWIQTEFVE